MNVSNSSNKSLPPPISQRLGASLSFLIIATICTVFYMVFIIALARKHKKFKSHAFYVFIYHFAAADIGLIAFTNYFISVPLSFAGRPLYGEGLILHLLSFSNTFFFRAVFFLVFLVSLNRFLVFFHPPLCAKLFERPNIFITMILPWTGGVIMESTRIFVGGLLYFSRWFSNGRSRQLSSAALGLDYE